MHNQDSEEGNIITCTQRHQSLPSTNINTILASNAILSVMPDLEVYINGITLYVLFCVSVFSSSTLHVRFIHFHCYMVLHRLTYHRLFFHSNFVPFGCCSFGPIMNNAALNILDINFGVRILGVEVLGHRWCLCSALAGTCILLSKTDVPVYTPNNSSTLDSYMLYTSSTPDMVSWCVCCANSF